MLHGNCFLKVFEDVYLPSKPTLQKALENLNYFFAFIFALEFVLKLIGLGLVGYFSSFWNCLDSLIVAVSLLEEVSLHILPPLSNLYVQDSSHKGIHLS